MVYHVAQFRRLDVAEQTLEKLVCTASLIIDDILLLEAHVARVRAIPIAQSLFDNLF